MVDSGLENQTTVCQRPFIVWLMLKYRIDMLERESQSQRQSGRFPFLEGLQLELAIRLSTLGAHFHHLQDPYQRRTDELHRLQKCLQVVIFKGMPTIRSSTLA